jgi:hypothetical protein
LALTVDWKLCYATDDGHLAIQGEKCGLGLAHEFWRKPCVQSNRSVIAEALAPLDTNVPVTIVQVHPTT